MVDAINMADLPNCETLRAEINNDVLSVWLNRPAARNAMNLAMCEELIALFASVRHDKSLRAVVLRAEGTAFCSGVDIREVAGNDSDWVLMRRNQGIDAFLAIEACPLPVICVVQGPALGAGCEIAAACDFVIASDDASFSWPEALRNSVGATQRLPRAVGRAMAKELLFTARKVLAEEARALGFANHVVPAVALDAKLEETLTAIRQCGPTAIKLIKQAVNLGETLDRNTAMNVERQLIAQSMADDEWRSGVADYTSHP